MNGKGRQKGKGGGRMGEEETGSKKGGSRKEEAERGRQKEGGRKK